MWGRGQHPSPHRRNERRDSESGCGHGSDSRPHEADVQNTARSYSAWNWRAHSHRGISSGHAAWHGKSTCCKRFYGSFPPASLFSCEGAVQRVRHSWREIYMLHHSAACGLPQRKTDKLDLSQIPCNFYVSLNFSHKLAWSLLNLRAFVLSFHIEHNIGRRKTLLSKTKTQITQVKHKYERIGYWYTRRSKALHTF